MRRRAGVFSLRIALALSVALSAFGCQPARQAEPIENVSEDLWGEALTVAGAILRYADVNGHFPDSKEALQDFCLRRSLPCANLDWTKVSWQHREKDTLTVNYSSQGVTIPITVTTQPTSLRVGDQTIMEELEKKLRESMEP